MASTQDTARELSSDGSALLVVTERQTDGRGRSGSVWENAPRAVAASLAFEPGWQPGKIGLIPLIAGVVARRAIGDEVGLKWPNDLLVGGRKVGGILVEAIDQKVVVGVGLNLWWPSSPEGIGAIADEDPGPDFGKETARTWASGLLAAVESGPDGWPRDEYTGACLTLGRAIEWEPSGSGKAVGIDAAGGLVVANADGETETLRSGVVRHVR